MGSRYGGLFLRKQDFKGVTILVGERHYFCGIQTWIAGHDFKTWRETIFLEDRDMRKDIISRDLRHDGDTISEESRQERYTLSDRSGYGGGHYFWGIEIAWRGTLFLRDQDRTEDINQDMEGHYLWGIKTWRWGGVSEESRQQLFLCDQNMEGALLIRDQDMRGQCIRGIKDLKWVNSFIMIFLGKKAWGFQGLYSLTNKTPNRIHIFMEPWCHGISCYK